MRPEYVCIIVLSLVCVTNASGPEDYTGSNRTATSPERSSKYLSIFSIVRFPNSGCASTNTLYNGTCLTTAECSSGGGTSYGSCASGFGVCCVFIVQTCGATTNKNCTYFQNPGYPSASYPPLQCSFTVNKCQTDICQIRLDFQNFIINQPSTTAYSATSANYQGQCVTDSFTVSGGSNPIPILCGTNTNQHIYVDMSSGQGAFTMTFNIGVGPVASTTARTWSIKTTQLPCNYLSNAPSQCLQYYTATTGTLTTFNYVTNAATAVQLANQDYTICVRMAEGFCGICYSLCTGTTPSAFSISDPAAKTAAGSTDCTADWINIPLGYAQGLTKSSDRFCGGIGLAATSGDPASPICSTSKPFEVRYRTDGNEASATDPSVGFCLNYNQQPCTS